MVILFQLYYLVSEQFFITTSSIRSTTKAPPTVVLPRTLTDDVIRLTYARAKKICTDRRDEISLKEKEIRFDFRQNGAAASHQRQLKISSKATKSKHSQEPFEETTFILSKTFNLTSNQIMYGLPKLDLGKLMTVSSDVQECEDQYRATCNSRSPYRTFDGICNNLRNPSWGSTSVCHQRLLEPDYADGISAKRVSITGRPLPTPRRISLEIHSHLNNPTDYVTHIFMVWGQFLDHDIALTPLSPEPDAAPLDCCNVSTTDFPECDPIILPRTDPFYSRFGRTCLSNLRSAMCSTCHLGPREQTNQLTVFIDASHIYGNNESEAYGLRNNDGTGTLRSTMFTGATTRRSVELPPPLDENICSTQDTNRNCFLTGDPRANQHPALTSMHILFLREHNRIARILQQLNRGWTDDRIFQETRKIVGALMQHITYNEFLPIVLGPERMKYFELNVLKYGYTQYDPTVNPTLINEFTTAAYRFGHSMANTFFSQILRYNSSGYNLRDMFQFPFILYNENGLDGLLNGLTQSPAQKFDRHMIPDLTNFLLRERGNETGLDLASLNINRGRDHGIPSYTKLMEFCGGPRIRNWNQLDKLFYPGVRQRFQRLYENVQDIDLFSGGLAEIHNDGAVIGPTFTCIVGIQFNHLKFGDRFYYEHGKQAGSFTAAQLREIKKITLGKLICQNTIIDRIQPRVMIYSGPGNPVQNCNNLPGMNLRVWS